MGFYGFLEGRKVGMDGENWLSICRLTRKCAVVLRFSLRDLADVFVRGLS
jgi:hypothetical protein